MSCFSCFKKKSSNVTPFPSAMLEIHTTISKEAKETNCYFINTLDGNLPLDYKTWYDSLHRAIISKDQRRRSAAALSIRCYADSPSDPQYILDQKVRRIIDNQLTNVRSEEIIDKSDLSVQTILNDVYFNLFLNAHQIQV